MRHLDEAGYLRSFAAETLRARKARGLSRAELAARTGVHESLIGALERGERDLRCVAQTRLLSALGCGGIRVEPDGVCFYLQEGNTGGLSARPAAAVVAAMAAAVRARREELGRSLDGLSRAAGLHRNSLWNFERGLVVPNGYTVYTLFRALDLSEARPELLFFNERPRLGPR